MIRRLSNALHWQVAKIAEECVHLATRTFPCSVIAKILVPIINQSHVENVSAIKFFGVLCQQVAKEELIPVIPSVVPHIITVNAVLLWFFLKFSVLDAAIIWLFCFYFFPSRIYDLFSGIGA